jgi:hypothetical protein
MKHGHGHAATKKEQVHAAWKSRKVLTWRNYELRELRGHYTILEELKNTFFLQKLVTTVLGSRLRNTKGDPV